MRAIVTVLGKDQVGIIANVCNVLASNGVNVLDISQTIMQDCFTMVMVVDTAGCKIGFSQLVQLLKESGEKMDLSVRIQREDIFEAMHRI